MPVSRGRARIILAVGFFFLLDSAGIWAQPNRAITGGLHNGFRCYHRLPCEVTLQVTLN